MEDLYKPPVYLIPAYEPSDELVDLVSGLAGTGRFLGGVVVDDGRGKQTRRIFQKISELPGVRVLTHSHNRGKGGALKTGMEFISSRWPRASGIVTADADGQHAMDDILHVSLAFRENPKALVLGTRRFDREVPFRSRLGNRVTAKLIHWLTGCRIKDTQTGLRGLPMGAAGWMVNIRSGGYDFEMDVLLACLARNIPVEEVYIKTIYLDHNQSSHFHPLMDSFRIYAVVLRYTLQRLTGAATINRRFQRKDHRPL